MRVKWVKTLRNLEQGGALGQASVQELWTAVTITIIKFSEMHNLSSSLDYVFLTIRDCFLDILTQESKSVSHEYQTNWISFQDCSEDKALESPVLQQCVSFCLGVRS